MKTALILTGGASGRRGRVLPSRAACSGSTKQAGRTVESKEGALARPLNRASYGDPDIAELYALGVVHNIRLYMATNELILDAGNIP
jgi:hypothetical protein